MLQIAEGVKGRFFVLFILLLNGCATAPPPAATWVPIGGKFTPTLSADLDRLPADRLACQGEVEKSNLSAHRQPCGAIGCMAQEADIRNSLDTVMKGCMAQRGWQRLN